MRRSLIDRIKMYIFEQGWRRIIRSIIKKLKWALVFFILYLLIVTPFIFNDFNYNLNLSKIKFASLVTDPARIKEQLKPNTEKKFLGQLQKTEYGLCYIHGFSASRNELEPVISNVAKKLKANLFFTRLSGHGYENPSVLSVVSAQNWIKDALECVEVASRSSDKVILIGTSMGASLATLVASHSKYKIHDLVLLSPNFGLKDKKASILAGYMGGLIANIYFKGQRSFKPKNKLQEAYWTTKYPASVIKQVMIVTEAVKSIDFSKLNMPVFIAYSKEDEILDVHQIEAKYELIRTNKRLDSSSVYKSHILAGDIINPKANISLQNSIFSFIKSNQQ